MITYDKRMSTKTVSDGFTQMLSETEDFFAKQGMSVLGNSFSDIITTKSFYEEYVDRLNEGIENPDKKKIWRVLMDNSRATILQEGRS